MEERDDGVDSGAVVVGLGLAGYSLLLWYVASHSVLGELSALRLGTASSALFVLYGGSVALAGWLEARSGRFGWLDDSASLVGLLMLGLKISDQMTPVDIPDFNVFLAAATVFLALPSAAAKYLTRGTGPGSN